MSVISLFVYYIIFFIIFGTNTEENTIKNLFRFGKLKSFIIMSTFIELMDLYKSEMTRMEIAFDEVLLEKVAKGLTKEDCSAGIIEG